MRLFLSLAAALFLVGCHGEQKPKPQTPSTAQPAVHGQEQDWVDLGADRRSGEDYEHRDVGADLDEAVENAREPQCLVPPCIDSEPLPPYLPDDADAPAMIEPSTVDSLRLQGDPRILPPESVRNAMVLANVTRVVATVKFCSDEAGRVTRTELLRSSGYEAYDAELQRQMRTWKYRPFLVEGRATPFCSTITFIYNHHP